MYRMILVVSWLCCFQISVAVAAEFTQFRGTNGSGVTETRSIPLTWSPTENIAWKIPVPGAGWSQPVLIGERLFLTTAVSDKKIKPKDFSSGVKMPQSMGLGGLTQAPNTIIQWQVHCYNSNTGELIWSKTIAEAKPRFPIHPSNTYATESPVADADGIYAFFGATGTVAGLNHQGQILWQKELGAFATNNGFGTGSSMAIDRGKVFVQHFTNGSGMLVCFNSTTGDQVWRVDRDKNESSWSSPLIWKNERRVELLSSGNDLICSYDPETGQELWRLSNIKSPTACSIAADNRQIYFGGSDPFSTGPLFAMQSGASGDVSPKKKNETFKMCSWLEPKGGPGMPSPASSGDYVYVVDKNVLKCYDAISGKRLYQNRLPATSMVASSPLVIGNQLLVISESGDATIVKVGPEFEVIGQGKLNDVFWSTPAIGDGTIYFRGVDALYCIRK